MRDQGTSLERAAIAARRTAGAHGRAAAVLELAGSVTAADRERATAVRYSVRADRLAARSHRIRSAA